MKYVITVMNISIDLAQCGLIWGLWRDRFIMKLINLLIRELENCSLGGDFRVSRHAKIYQFDRFSLEINFKRPRSYNYGIPRLYFQVKMKIIYSTHHRDTHVTITLYDVEVICLIIDRTQSRHFIIIFNHENFPFQQIKPNHNWDGL